jgi:hypothetical protein
MTEDRPLPEIAECDVARDGDGLKLTHRRSRDTEWARDEEHAEVKGALLRISAVYAREALFRTGDQM